MKQSALIILDGFGYRKESQWNPIAQAETPNLNSWLTLFPHCFLEAAGPAVGLPDGYIGNSEVGHLTIGSGRIILQPVTLLNNQIRDKQFENNPILIHSFEIVKKQQSSLHIMGLLSDAGVHSHISHLFAFIDSAINYDVTDIIVHPFLDGRDVPPQSAPFYLKLLEDKLAHVGKGRIGSLHGRFYAMDRDQHWNRTEQSYNVLTQGTSEKQSWQDIIDHNYHKGITDEFIPPTSLEPHSFIKPHDAILFFNFRPDRARQLTACFVDQNFNYFTRKKLPLSTFITPVNYGNNLKTIYLLPDPLIKHTLKEVLTAHKKTIFSIAETEKYAHVTYFFDGGCEIKFEHETRVLIPSILAKNYVEYPCMSASEITKTVIESLLTNPADFYVINYANADMVGHSGNFDATVHAIECIDKQLGILYEQLIQKMNGTIYITADHGKAEEMYNSLQNYPNTAHTTNLVPFIMLQQNLKKDDMPLPLKELSDIAPFILKQMHLPIPQEMKKQ